MNETKGHVTLPLSAYNEMRDRIKELEAVVRDRDYTLERIDQALMVMRLTPNILEAIDLDSVVVYVDSDPCNILDNANHVRISFTVPKDKVVI
jgi:hypothetical protein